MPTCLYCCWCVYLCVCVCVFGQAGSCLHLRLETRYSLKIQLLVWSQQLFSPTRLLPAPPSLPPPSVFLMLFQLQTFRMMGISLTTHTEFTYIYSFFIYLLPLYTFPTKFPLCRELSKIQIRLIGTIGEKPVLLEQGTSVTYQYFHIFLTASASLYLRLWLHLNLRFTSPSCFPP